MMDRSTPRSMSASISRSMNVVVSVGYVPMMYETRACRAADAASRGRLLWVAEMSGSCLGVDLDRWKVRFPA
jgi:hypothetical protein